MFKEDLEKGEKFELYVAKQLYEKYNLHYTKNNDKMGVDLLGEQGNMEVKYDIGSDETGNYFFEVLCNNKPAGILKQAKYFCIGTYDEFYVFDRVKLMGIILTLGDRVKGGDGNRVTGYLLKKEIAKKYFTYNY